MRPRRRPERAGFTEDELELLAHVTSLFIMQTAQRILKRSFRGEDTSVFQQLLDRARILNEKIKKIRSTPPAG